MGMDFCGDLLLVLFEVFDLEQNYMFVDYYIEVDFDLLDVMFVVMLNLLNILLLLFDWMEVICLLGYMEDEKVSIVQCYLLLKQKKNNGLKEGEIDVIEQVICDIICYYMCEVGVCLFEWEVLKICCKVVKMLLLKKVLGVIKVDGENFDMFFGVCKYDFGFVVKENQVGQVMGFVWMEVGGDLLMIEVVVMFGKGNVICMGLFGDVMKELVEVVCLVVCLCLCCLGIKDEVFEKQDIYIYVLEGVMLKDGLFVGGVMMIVLVLVLMGIFVCVDVVMMGEIMLCGEVLLIGGLKEKLLVVYCGGIKFVLILEENVKDFVDILDNVKNVIEIVLVCWIDKVLEFVFECLLMLLLLEEEVKVVVLVGEVVKDVGLIEVVKY